MCAGSLIVCMRVCPIIAREMVCWVKHARRSPGQRKPRTRPDPPGSRIASLRRLMFAICRIDRPDDRYNTMGHHNLGCSSCAKFPFFFFSKSSPSLERHPQQSVPKARRKMKRDGGQIACNRKNISLLAGRATKFVLVAVLKAISHR